jgi:hypothetical protein
MSQVHNDPLRLAFERKLKLKYQGPKFECDSRRFLKKGETDSLISSSILMRGQPGPSCFGARPMPLKSRIIMGMSESYTPQGIAVYFWVRKEWV